MTKRSDDKAVARVVSVLKDAFGPSVDLELTRESPTIFRVKATAADDEAISNGLEAMKAARLRSAIDGDGVAVKMIDGDDADEYLIRASSESDPAVREAYEALARDARGE